MNVTSSPEASAANALRQPIPCPTAEPPSAIRDMTDDEIQTNLGEIEEDLAQIAISRAEIRSEAAHFGDGPAGSASRLDAMSQSEQRLLREKATLGTEWRRRHPPAPRRAFTPPGDEGVSF